MNIQEQTTDSKSNQTECTKAQEPNRTKIRIETIYLVNKISFFSIIMIAGAEKQETTSAYIDGM